MVALPAKRLPHTNPVRGRCFVARRGSKLLTLGGKAFYVMEGVNIAGMAVVLTAQGRQQVEALRSGVIGELAHVEAEISEISRTNLADPRLAQLKTRREQLIEEGRSAVTHVFENMVAQQALFLAAGAAVHAVGQARLGRQVNALKAQNLFVEQGVEAPYVDYTQGKIVGNSTKVSAGELARLEQQVRQARRLQATVPDAVQRQRIVEALGGRDTDVGQSGGVTRLERQGGRRLLRVAANATPAQIEGLARLPADIREQVSLEVVEGLPARQVELVPEPAEIVAGEAGTAGTGAAGAGRINRTLRPRIRMRVSAQATTADIVAHGDAVRGLQSLLGLQGRLRILLARVNKRVLPPLSQASLAREEVRKLTPQIARLRAALQEGTLTPEQQRQTIGELADLDAQVQAHEHTWNSGDRTPADPYLAALHDETLRNAAPALLAGLPADAVFDRYRSNWPAFLDDYFFRRDASGRYEIVRKNARAPALQLENATRDLSQAKVIKTQALDMSFPAVKGRAGVEYPQSLSGFAELEDALNATHHPTMAGQAAAWSAEDAGLIRKWGPLLQQARQGLRLDLAPLLAQVRTLRPGYGETAYRAFYRDVRVRIAQALADVHDRGVQMQELARCLAAAPDMKSKGELFSAFREALMRPNGTLHPNFETVENVSVFLGEATPGGKERIADGVFAVTRPVRASGAPPVGRFLAEDKAGASAFKLDQAQDYSRFLDQGSRAGTITTQTTGQGSKALAGGTYDGVVYCFDTQEAAETAMESIRRLNSHIYVSYFDTSGNLIWVRR